MFLRLGESEIEIQHAPLVLRLARLDRHPQGGQVGNLLGTVRFARDHVQAQLRIGEAEKLAPGDPEVLYYAAMVYVQAGDQKKSLEKLERAVAAGYPAAGVRDTPNFLVLGNDPRFRALIAQAHKKGKTS